jgi:hypothetical protein
MAMTAGGIDGNERVWVDPGREEREALVVVLYWMRDRSVDKQKSFKGYR